MIFDEGREIQCGLCESDNITVEAAESSRDPMADGLMSIEVWLNCRCCDSWFTFHIEASRGPALSWRWGVEEHEEKGH